MVKAQSGYENQAPEDHKEIRTGVRYHPYYWGAIAFDAEWSRRRLYDETEHDPSQSLAEVIGSVTATCKEYFDKCKKFAKLTGATNPGRKSKDAFCAKDDLYAPQGFIPLGHSDVAAFLLFDDIDILQGLAAHAETSVEEVSFGYCPVISDLSADPWMVEPHQFLQRHKDGVNRGFSTFSALKLHGAIAIGNSVDLEFSLYKLVIQAVRDTVRSVRSHPEIWNDFEVTEKELNSLSISIIDLLGQEEIGILIHSTNLSLSHMIVARIQNVRLSALIGTSGDSRTEFHEQHWIQDLLRFYETIEGAPSLSTLSEEIGQENIVAYLGNGHILRWTKSTVYLPASFLDKEPSASPITGYMDPFSETNLCVGHQRNFEKTLSSHKERLRPLKKFPPSLEARVYRLGSADASFHFRDLDPNDCEKMMESSVFAMNLGGLLSSFVSGEKSHEQVRNVVGMITHVNIPLPASLKASGESFAWPEITREGHNNILEYCLPVMRWRLFGSYRSKIDRSRMRYKPGKKPRTSNFDLALIQRSFRANAGPCRTLGSLFQNYASFVANPFIFDAVLDLFDPIATLHNQVRALDERATSVGQDYYENVASSIQLDLISTAAKVLHGSMVHRIHRAFPEQIYREVDIDFRGGLNQVIYAADGVLKIATGFLRYFVLPQQDGPKKTGRDQVGVISHVSSDTGIAIDRFRLGIERRGRMAVVRFDVPHAMHGVSWVELFVESFHLIYAELRNPTDRHTKALLPLVPINSKLNRNMSELFSALLACLVIDRKDPARLCQHLTIAYATSPRLAGHRLDARREMISDWIINQFLIQKTVMTYMEPTALTGESREISWHDAAIKDEFGNLIFECLALFPYTAWLALSPDELQNSETHNAIFWRSKIRDQLGEFRSQIIQAYDDRMIIYANYVNLIGGAAKKIFDKYRDHIANSAEEGSLDAITEAVAKSLDRGDPVSWSKIDTAWSNQGGAKDDDSILSGVLTAATLRWMLIQRSERIIGRVRKFREAAVACQNENFSDEMIDYLLRLHLPRLPQKRGIDEEFLKDALFQNSDFMVDRNRVTLFSSNLEERKTRLEHQVVGTKTLLGVSARMKARRFSDMLERATPAQ